MGTQHFRVFQRYCWFIFYWLLVLLELQRHRALMADEVKVMLLTILIIHWRGLLGRLILMRGKQSKALPHLNKCMQIKPKTKGNWLH